MFSGLKCWSLAASAVLALFNTVYVQAQWIPVQVSDRWLTDVYFQDESNGYTGGVSGIYKTNDGGQNWTILPYFDDVENTPDEFHLSFMNEHYFGFISPQVGYSVGWGALGNEEMIIRTLDAGETWEIQHRINPDDAIYQPISSALQDIHVVNSSVLWTAGNKGRILKTNDGGANWLAVDLDIENELKTIQFVGQHMGYAAGDGVFLRSLNGGIDWEITEINYDINDLHFTEESHGFAVTAGNHILETHDKGDTWVVLPYESTGSLLKIQFLTPAIGYALGYYEVLKTEDGGESWYIIGRADGSDGYYSSLYFLDELNGYITSTTGVVFKTTNGGFSTALSPVLDSVSQVNTFPRRLITVYGKNMLNIKSVYFGSEKAKYSIESDSLFTFIIPSGATSGSLSVEWREGSVTYATPITIGIRPFVDPYRRNTYVNRGDTLEFTGEDLDHIAKVTISNAYSAEYIVPRKNLIQVIVPPGFPPGEREFEFFNGEGEKVYNDSDLIILGPPVMLFTRVPDHPFISRKTDFAAGRGLTIELTGEELANTEKMWLGSIELDFEVIDNTRIKFVVPENATTDFLRLQSGSGNATSPLKFEVLEKPIIERVVTKDKIRFGDTLTIYGQNFRQDGSFFVDIGGRPNRTLEVKNEFIAKVIYTLGEGNLTIGTLGGFSDGDFPIYRTDSSSPDPYVTSIEPKVAKIGTLIRLEGYLNADSILFSNQKIANQVYVPYPISFEVRAGMTSSVVDLYSGGERVFRSDSIFITDTPPPFISNITPSKATAGSKLTVEGHYFRQTDSVFVGGVRAFFSVLDSVRLRVIVPAGAAGGEVKIYGQYGVAESDDKLRLSPKRFVKPEIYSLIRSGYDASNLVHSGAFVSLLGNNLDMTEYMKIGETLITDYTIVTDDSIVFEVPYIEFNSFHKLKLILGSKAGESIHELRYSTLFELKVASISPLEGARGAPITIEFEPPYLERSLIITKIFINGIECEKQSLADDDLSYRIFVPDSGDVNGEITFQEYGGVKALGTGYNFSLIEDEYCEIGAYLDNDSPPAGVQHIKFGAIDNDTDDLCARYSDYTHLSTDVYPGHVYPLEIISDDCGFANVGHSVRVFIDWNADKDFDEQEVAMETEEIDRYSPTAIKMIRIPGNIAIGQSVRMRIVKGLYESIDEITACGNNRFGEAEDYTINLRPHPAGHSIHSFYPAEGSPGAVVMVNGSGFNALNNIYLNGVSVDFEVKSNTLLELTVPNTTSGRFAFQFPGQTISSTTEFTMSFNHEAPVIDQIQSNTRVWLFQNVEGIYDVRIGDQHVPFIKRTKLVEFQPNRDIENGIICIYSKGGYACSETPLEFPPKSLWATPGEGAVGTPVTLHVWPNHNLTEVKIGDVPVEFQREGLNEIKFNVPEGATTAKITAENNNGISATNIDFNVLHEPCEPVAYFTRIIDKVEIGIIENETALAYGYSDFTHLSTIVAPNESYTMLLDYKEHYDCNVYIDWNNDFDFNDTMEELFVWKGRTGVKVPNWAVTDRPLTMRVSAKNTTFSPIRPCSANEVQDYTLIVKRPGSETGDIVRDVRVDFTWFQQCSDLLMEFYDQSDYYHDLVYQWDFGDGTNATGRFARHNYAAAGSYQVTLTVSGEDQQWTGMALVEVANDFLKPTIVYDHSPLICEGETLDVEVQENYRFYEWSNGQSGQKISITQSATLSARVSNDGVCWSQFSDATDIHFLTPPGKPVIQSTGSLISCNGQESATLSAPAGFSQYEWSNGLITREIDVFQYGGYKVRVGDSSGCWSEFSESFIVQEGDEPGQPTIEIVGNTTLCEGESLILRGPPGYEQYEWNNGHVSSTLEVIQPGSYSVRVANSTGCWSIYSENVEINIVNKPEKPLLIVNEYSFCSGESVPVSAPVGFAHYEWTNGAMVRSVEISEPATIRFRVANDVLCWSPYSDEINITSLELPGAFISQIGDTLVASEGDFYNWYLDDEPLAYHERKLLVRKAGAYAVEVFNIHGCSRLSDDIDVNLVITSIDDEVIDEIMVYPNPVEGGDLNLSAVTIGSDFEILDALGHKIMQGSLEGLEINVITLLPGVYTLRVLSKESTSLIRFVKQ